MKNGNQSALLKLAGEQELKKKRPKPERPEKAYQRPPRDKMIRGGDELTKGPPRRARPQRSKKHG